MRRLVLIGLFAWLFILAFNSSFSENMASSRARPDPKAILNQGLNSFWNNDYTAARVSFALYMQLVPADPVGDWRSALNDYFELRYLQKTDEPKLNGVAYAKFIVRIDKGVEKCEIKLAKNEAADLNLFVEASLYGLKAIVEKANDGKGAALSDGIKSLELARKSGYQDAKFIVGAVGYEVSKRGFFIRHVAPLVGYPNDRKEGLLLIRVAAENKPGQFADDIPLYMFKILTDEKVKKSDRAKNAKVLGVTSEELYRRLKDKYPGNETIRKYVPDSP